MMINSIKQYIERFIKLIAENKIEIYNEFSLQHELGIYLRTHIDNKIYKIQFERNIGFFNINKENMCKKEMDIVIYNNDKTKKYIIELKFPKNGQYPESMFSFIKDIKFCEELVHHGFNGGICVTIANDPLFYSAGVRNKASKEGIYRFFRSNKQINGEIRKPTGRKDEVISLKKSYSVKWNDIMDVYKYYIVSI